MMNNRELPWDETDFRLIIGSTGIEYDSDKEEINRRLHGYSLESAQYILERAVDPFSEKKALLITREVVRAGEVRHEHLTQDDHRNVVFIVTTMRPGETVRIISFRPASLKERVFYHLYCLHIIQIFRR